MLSADLISKIFLKVLVVLTDNSSLSFVPINPSDP